MIKGREVKLIFAFSVFLILFFALDLFSGDMKIGWKDIFSNDSQNATIFYDFRLPRVLCALTVGAGLSVAGILLQTLFNNPLAGPYVLGINTGSSLLVSIALMIGGSALTSMGGVFMSSILGAFGYSIIILSFSKWVKSKNTLLLVGVMLSSFTASIIGIIQYQASAESIKAFTIWSMGSLQTASKNEAIMMLLLVFIVLIPTFFLAKQLNILKTGESNALSLGLNTKRLRFWIIVYASVITGIVTAYCGPIAFVGLAVPNLVRKIGKSSNHFFLIISCFLVGACVMLLCDIALQYLNMYLPIPVNALTALVGAPIVISILLKK
jgi:iron complex transport system permease protein